MANGVLKYDLTIQIDALKRFVTPDTVKKFVELSSGTREDYCRAVRGENWRDKNAMADMYGFDPFAFMPAIKVESSLVLPENTYVVPQPFFLIQRTSVGLFYLLGDKEREIGAAQGYSGRNEFRQSFGDVYREYVGKHLALAVAPTVFVDLDREIRVDFEKPDFALIAGETCVLFEVKMSLLDLDARTFFDEAKVRAAAQGGGLKRAIGQLNTFADAVCRGKIADKRFSGITKVVKVIVGFEDLFLANAILIPLLRETHGEANMIGYQVATITDIEQMGTMLSQGGDLVSFLHEKAGDANRTEDALAPVIFAKSLDGRKENPLLDKAFKEVWSRMTGGAAMRDDT